MIVTKNIPPADASITAASSRNTLRSEEPANLDLQGHVNLASNKLQCTFASSEVEACGVLKVSVLSLPNLEKPDVLTTMLPSAISALLVVLGWYVVNKAQGNRERRKQIREHINALCNDLGELEDLTFNYHSSDRDESKESLIIAKLGRFEKECSTLPRFLAGQKFIFRAVVPSSLKVDPHLIKELKQTMTLAHFGEEHKAPVDRQDDVITGLLLATEKMRDALEGVRISALD